MNPRTSAALVRLIIPTALVLLVVWAAVTLTTDAPGWVNALLTTGVLLLIYGVVRRGTERAP